MELTTSQEQMKERLIGAVANAPNVASESVCLLIKPLLIECSFEKKTLTMEFEAQKWQGNLAGDMHGGVVATLLDTAMGFLNLGYLGYPPPTVSLSVNYLRPSPVEGAVCVFAKLDKQGRSMYFTSGELYIKGDRDRLLATSTGTYMPIK